ncbi:hypothetical protein ACIBQ0_10190 [Nocardia nova]|uniref:hypothetical protein n=1 Tax=Nocardia nova TaxID=37330 RepID=UPI003793DF72
MSAPNIPDPWADARSTMYWLPPGGIGNGVTARAWAILADLTEKQVYPVLFALSEAGIAGYAAAVRTRVLEPGDRTMMWRLWVDTLHYNAAADVVMEQVR